MAHASGLQEIRVKAVPYHFYPGRIPEDELRLWRLKLDIALPLMEQALGSGGKARALRERFLNYLRREDSMTYSVLFSVEGTKGAS